MRVPERKIVSPKGNFAVFTNGAEEMEAEKGRKKLEEREPEFPFGSGLHLG